jgi:ketosteroid isomerase-like protein
MPRLPASGLRAGLLLSAFLFAACASAQHDAPVHAPPGSYPPAPPAPVPGAAEIVASVRAVLDAQVAAWNRGDVRGFMNGSARHDSLVFISGGTLRRGWQENLYAYMRNYPDRAAMGTLSFEDVHVRPLAPDLALAYGVWRLRRAEDEPLGLFSLLFRETEDGWRIFHDHTSSAP